MARPKSTKPIKDKILSVRLTKEDYVKIKTTYGSIQAFLDLMIKTLPIVLLMACNGVPSTSQEAPVDQSIAKIYKTDYASIEFISRGAALSYKLTHHCDDYQCEIHGDLGTYLNNVQYNGTGYLADFHFVKTIIRRADGNFYQGQICDRDGRLCYELRFNPTSKYAAVSNGAVCMISYKYIYKEEYDLFINRFSDDLGTTNSQYLQFLDAAPDAVCGF